MMFRIGNVQKILGVSAETLRYFEKKGIVVPKRDAENNYRYYDGRDVNAIVGYRFFRSMGFSMNESIDLIHFASNEEAHRKMEERELQIHEQILQQQRILKRLQFQKTLYQRGAAMVGKYLLEELPGYLFYYNQKNRTFELEETQRNCTQCWIQEMPQSMVAYHIPQNHIHTNGFIHWGYAFQLEEDAEPLPLALENLPYSIKRPKQKAVFTVLKVIEEDLKVPGRFDPLLDYVTATHMAVDGDIFGTIISNEWHESKFIRYFAAWVPVKPLKKKR